MSVSYFCPCGGAVSRIFDGNVMFICNICNKPQEKSLPNDSLISEINKNTNSSTKYFDFINNAKQDLAATKIDLSCKKCNYPILHYIHVGEDMMPYYICPDMNCDFIMPTADYKS